ncbi:RluA family pseudouridine synthase [Kiloniella sp. b19]|uniref:RluA family pseudouridine synthase n=1 Tax=Kiloniella sp. GXU_MW_B19 TaxID=3141326 RepID=UPI0031D7F131
MTGENEKPTGGVRLEQVGRDDDGMRLDRWFKKHVPALSHIQVEKALRKGQIRLDGKRAKGATRIEAGQSVRIPPTGEGKSGAAGGERRQPQSRLSAEEIAEIRDWVIYRDEWIIAINKPAGLAVQGGSGQTRHLDGMLEALRYNADERPRLVHRLDKDTSGLLLLARNATIARSLAKIFEGRSAHKIYWALVRQTPSQDKGWISLPLAKHPSPAGEKMVVDEEDGKESLSLYYKMGKARKGVGWVALMPLTGRTHQLRVHCAASEAPILGDGKYGGRDAYPFNEDFPKDLMLHARELSLPHPHDGTTLRLQAPVPTHMSEALSQLRFDQRKGEDAVDVLEQYATDLKHCPPRAIDIFFRKKPLRD